MAPTTRDYFISGLQLISGSRTKAERHIAEERNRDIAAFLNIHNPIRVLDVANGALRPQYNLLLEDGQDVYGIDLINKPSFTILGYAYRLARWLYRLHIDDRSAPSSTRLVCGNVCQIPFPQNSFDLVTSVAAFEHFLDVPQVIREIYRILRPGGLAWIRIHPFTCLSGGHNLSFTEIPIQKVPIGIQPWDHLRSRKLPIKVPLNKWRIGDYLEAFVAEFDILRDYCALREGEHILTKSIELELNLYSRDELTCASYVIVARKLG